MPRYPNPAALLAKVARDVQIACASRAEAVMLSLWSNDERSKRPLMERTLSRMAAQTELAALMKESERVRCLLEEEGSEKSLVADVMRMQLGILQARIRQHCREHGLIPERRTLLPALRVGDRRG